MSFTRSFAGDRERKAAGLGSRDLKLRGSSEKRRRGEKRKALVQIRGDGQRRPRQAREGGKEGRTTGDGGETACLQRAEKGKRTWEGTAAGQGWRQGSLAPSHPAPGTLPADLGEPSSASASSSSLPPFSPPRRRLRFGDSPAEPTRWPSRKRHEKKKKPTGSRLLRAAPSAAAAPQV